MSLAPKSTTTMLSNDLCDDLWSEILTKMHSVLKKFISNHYLMHFVSAFGALALTLTSCSSFQQREISGRLIYSKSQKPVPNQSLVLDRPPGQYPGIFMLVGGVPQQVSIASTRTDERGNFFLGLTKIAVDSYRYYLIKSQSTVGTSI